MPRLNAFLVLFLLVSFSPAGFTQAPGPELSEAQHEIRKILESSPTRAMEEPVVMHEALLEIYSPHHFSPLWTSNHQVRQIVAALEESLEYGLLPQDYHLPAIKALLDEIRLASDPAFTAALDVLLSDGLLLYIHHRREGKTHPRDLYPEFNFERDHSADLQPVELIQQARAAGKLAAFINAEAPNANYYELLRQQLRVYRAIAANGGWPSVPSGPTLRKNDQDPRVVAIRERLQLTGELQSPPGNAPDRFTGELENAVILFQSLHGLAVDGLVGKKTLAAMNVGVTTRVNQLRLSLERLRWLEHNADHEFLAVNIASFRLAYVKNQSVEWTTRVVVGTPFRSTPVFRSLMTYVEFNPTWTIPPTILQEDILPAIRNNPAYLADRNISVIDSNGNRLDPSAIDWTRFRKSIPYMLRQEPGPANALGQVKFIFPNPYSVYMHDTPYRALFEQPMRGYSSGCIRVENPFRLVELVLQQRQDFAATELDDILRSGRTRRVLLENPLPVLILYLTAALDDSGRVHFYPDIYERDPALLRLLDKPVTEHVR